jgi:hypothetical protein
MVGQSFPTTDPTTDASRPASLALEVNHPELHLGVTRLDSTADHLVASPLNLPS